VDFVVKDTRSGVFDNNSGQDYRLPLLGANTEQEILDRKAAIYEEAERQRLEVSPLLPFCLPAMSLSKTQSLSPYAAVKLCCTSQALRMSSVVRFWKLIRLRMYDVLGSSQADKRYCMACTCILHHHSFTVSSIHSGCLLWAACL